MTPREAFYAPTERVSAAAAVGRVAAEFAVPYPPGIPALAPGRGDRRRAVGADPLRGGARRAHRLRVGPGARQLQGGGGLTSATPARRLAARLQQHADDDDRPADQRGRRGPLRHDDPHPQRAEHDLEQRDRGDLGRRDQPGADREQRQAEADLARAEQDQQHQVAPVDACRGGRTGRRTTKISTWARQVAGAIDMCRWWRVITMLTANESGMTIVSRSTRMLPLPGAPDHHADAGERDHHRRPRARRDRLAQADPCEQRREHRRGRLQEEDARDGRVVERDDERRRRERRRDAHAEHGPAALAHLAGEAVPVPGEHEDRQGHEGEERPAGHLRPQADVQLALEDAGGRPGDGGEGHVDLPAAMLRSRHAVDRNGARHARSQPDAAGRGGARTRRRGRRRAGRPGRSRSCPRPAARARRRASRRRRRSQAASPSRRGARRAGPSSAMLGAAGSASTFTGASTAATTRGDVGRSRSGRARTRSRPPPPGRRRAGRSCRPGRRAPWRWFSARAVSTIGIALVGRRGGGRDPLGGRCDRVDPAGCGVVVLDRAAGGAGRGQQPHRLGDAGRVGGEAALAVDRERHVGGGGEAGDVGDELVAGDAAGRFARASTRTRRSSSRGPESRTRRAGGPSPRPTGSA